MYAVTGARLDGNEVLRLSFDGLVIGSSARAMRQTISQEARCYSAKAVVVDTMGMAVALERGTLAHVAQTVWNDSPPDPHIPIAFIVPAERFDLANEYCSLMADEGFARGAFVSETSALRWVERRLRLVWHHYDQLPRSCPHGRALCAAVRSGERVCPQAVARGQELPPLLAA
jgi:hypothetical protein